MRVMVLIKASQASEEGVMPSTDLLMTKGEYNEQAVEVCRVAEADDFGEAFTPELREKEERIREETERRA